MTLPPFNSIAAHPLLARTRLGRVFNDAPFGYIDIGARRHEPPLVAPVAALTSFLGFEPDASECAAMNADVPFTAPWAKCATLPIALARTRGEASLYLTDLATNASLYKPNDVFTERYKPKGMKPLGMQQVETRTLDEIIAERGGATEGEFIKLDTQGSELDILCGGENVITQQTLCIVTEVEFFQQYEAQPLFSDVERYLRDLGFSFYDLYSINRISQKRLDKARESGRERLRWADAVFFRDPFDNDRRFRMSERQGYALFTAALVLGYHDFALEIAEGMGGERSEGLAELVRACAAVHPGNTVSALGALVRRVEKAPALANLIVGRFVDNRRHLNDVKNVRDLEEESD